MGVEENLGADVGVGLVHPTAAALDEYSDILFVQLNVPLGRLGLAPLEQQ